MPERLIEIRTIKPVRDVPSTRYFPVLPPVAEGYHRCIHVTHPHILQSIFNQGINILGGLVSHCKFFGQQTSIPLTEPKKIGGCYGMGLFTHPETGDIRFKRGVAVICDLPETVVRLNCIKVIPTQSIQGAVTRKGKYIPNPNYDRNFNFQQLIIQIHDQQSLIKNRPACTTDMIAQLKNCQTNVHPPIPCPDATKQHVQMEPW